MDSLTQIALGAAVGEAVAGRQFGRRALIWGAICGTLPDLDVFVPLGDAVRDFTYHRAASHSLLMLALATPLVAWLIMKLHPDTAAQRWRWAALVYLAFATHVLLDSFTVYGTQIFWPVDTTPVGWSTIFIIDPLYTLPLLIGVIAAYIAARRGVAWGRVTNTVGLVLSSAYLMWTVGVKWHVEQLAEHTLHQQNMAHTDVLTVPTPFNSLLWRILVVNGTHYYEGFYSIFDSDPTVQFAAHPRTLELIAPLSDSWPVQRLQWFTKNFYAVQAIGNNIVMSDLRMGLEPDYVFRFKVGELGNPHAYPAPVERVVSPRSFDGLPALWARIWRQPSQ